MAYIYCPNCNSMTNTEYKKCFDCGFVFENKQTENKQTKNSLDIHSISEIQDESGNKWYINFNQNLIYCGKCRSELHINDKYCNNCGLIVPLEKIIKSYDSYEDCSTPNDINFTPRSNKIIESHNVTYEDISITKSTNTDSNAQYSSNNTIAEELYYASIEHSGRLEEMENPDRYPYSPINTNVNLNLAEILSKDTIDKIIKESLNFSNLDLRDTASIKCNYGEPLLQSDVIRSVFNIPNTAKIYIAVSSNIFGGFKPKSKGFAITSEGLYYTDDFKNKGVLSFYDFANLEIKKGTISGIHIGKYEFNGYDEYIHTFLLKLESSALLVDKNLI